jgi:NAD(P)-dependent dehydrogenase (short-subunit alcohol dehydrogenase family)
LIPRQFSITLSYDTQEDKLTIEPFVDFQGKQILVSGASSGLGRAICVELSKRSARLILLGRDRGRLMETASGLASTEFHLLVLDLSSLSEIGPRVRALASEIGRIYGFCHSAGVVETRPLAALDIEGTRKTLDINFVSGVELARTVARKDVMEEDGGAILFISSVYARVGVGGEAIYSGSKGAINAAARAMAVELARKRIRVNTLSPGLVRTPMTDTSLSALSSQQVKDLENAHPLGVGSPEDVARAATFLLAPQNPWITGADWVIDGGLSAR